MNEHKKNAVKIVRKSFIRTVTTGCLVACTSIMASAAGTGAETTLTNFVEFLFTITRIIGIAGALLAFVQIGLAVKGHDPSSRDQAFLGLAGALIILFAKEILTSIGVSV